MPHLTRLVTSLKARDSPYCIHVAGDESRLHILTKLLTAMTFHLFSFLGERLYYYRMCLSSFINVHVLTRKEVPKLASVCYGLTISSRKISRYLSSWNQTLKVSEHIDFWFMFKPMKSSRSRERSRDIATNCHTETLSDSIFRDVVSNLRRLITGEIAFP